MSDVFAFLLERAHLTPAMTVILTVIGIIARSTAVLCIGGCIAKYWPRISAAQRHLAWTMTCAIAVLTPVLQLAVPAWNVAVASVAVPSSRLASSETLAASNVGLRFFPTMQAAPPLTLLQSSPISLDVIVAVTLCTLWLVGMFVAGVVFFRTHVRARRLIDETVSCDSSQVLRIARRVGAAFEIAPNRCSVRYHATAMPFVYGIRRPIVVLPVSAAHWSPEQMHDVLCHELAHVARNDMVAQLVTSAACAVYWFNPLAWLAARAVRTEREIACDDRVLNAGARPSRYATHLLDLARTFEAPSEASVAALAFARPAQIHTRLRSIVDPVRRRAGVTRRSLAFGLVLSVGAAYPLLALTPVLKNVLVSNATRTVRSDLSRLAAPAALHPHPQENTMKRSTALATAALLSAAASHDLHAQKPAVVHEGPCSATAVRTSMIPRDVRLVVRDSSRVISLVDFLQQSYLHDFVRGDPSQDLMVVVDGVRFSTTPSSSSPVEEIDRSNIKNMEARGGCDVRAHYGPDAARGVVLITTKAYAESHARKSN
jgi:beta-lactamase regulating signal transducer with metallopeptidase domain